MTSLLAFNVGVEIGQLAVLLVTIPALVLLFRYVVAERIGTILLSALVAHTAWHWAIDRGTALMAISDCPEFTLQDMAAGDAAADGDHRRGRAGVADLVWTGSNPSNEPSRASAREAAPSAPPASDPATR